MSSGRTSRWVTTLPPSRRNVRWRPAGASRTVPATDRHSLGGLDHPQRRHLVELARVHLGIAERHVQHDGDRHRASRPAGWESRCLSACGPPVEMPMHDDVDVAARGARRDGDWNRRCDRAAARRVRRRLDLVDQLVGSYPSAARWPAPSASARNPRRRRRAPASTCSPAPPAMLMITIGIGSRAICSRTKPTPSSTGMFRSQVTTSGCSAAALLQRLGAVAGDADDLDERAAPEHLARRPCGRRPSRRRRAHG